MYYPGQPKSGERSRVGIFLASRPNVRRDSGDEDYSHERVAPEERPVDPVHIEARRATVLINDGGRDRDEAQKKDRAESSCPTKGGEPANHDAVERLRDPQAARDAQLHDERVKAL